MNLPLRQKLWILGTAVVLCAIATVFLHGRLIVAYGSITACLLTIILPLIGSLFVYKGRFARIVFGLVIVASLFALVFAVDGLASIASFQHACEARPGYSFAGGINNLQCNAHFEPMEANSFFGNRYSVSGLLVYPYIFLLFLALLNPLVMLIQILRNYLKQRHRTA